MTTAPEKTVKDYTDDELRQRSAEAQAELALREETRKRETIARIKEMAASVGVAVNIGGRRGRPAGVKGAPKAAKHGTR